MIMGFLRSQVRLTELAPLYDVVTKRGKRRRRSNDNLNLENDPTKFYFAGYLPMRISFVTYEDTLLQIYYVRLGF